MQVRRREEAPRAPSPSADTPPQPGAKSSRGGSKQPPLSPLSPSFCPSPFPPRPAAPRQRLSAEGREEALGAGAGSTPAEPPRRPSEPLGTCPPHSPCPPHGPLRPPPPARLGAAAAGRLPPQLLLPRREELSPPLAVSHRGRRAKERDEAPAAGWCGGDGRLEAGALLRRGRAGGAAPGDGPLRALFTCGRDHSPPLLLLLFT